ncbi:MAG: hypothetical protein IJ493_10540 [Clostridia bacterium]|nr:hypothetical protein [Clostridia bacterium]
MTSKKWLVMFISTLSLVLLLYGGFNIAVDPFGVFGDPILDWYSYNETLNPRAAKIAYIDANRDEYDSFVLGSSSAASYDPAKLNKYTGGRWYNLFVYGCDAADYLAYTKYLLASGEVKQILLNLGLNEANYYDTPSESIADREHYLVTGDNPLTYSLDHAYASLSYSFEKLSSRATDTELPQVFDVFNPDTGCYDKRVRDIEPIGDMEYYLSRHSGDFPEVGSGNTLPHASDCASAVAEIVRLCEESGVELTVVFSPAYISQWNASTVEAISSFKRQIGEITDFWDFSLTPLSYDSRYFYDDTHFRNGLGDMVLARIWGGDIWLPDGFGSLVSADTLDGFLDGLSDVRQLEEGEYAITVPILLYDAAVPEAHRKALTDAEYNVVSAADLIAYVERGTSLPERAVCLLSSASDCYIYPDGSEASDETEAILRADGVALTVLRGDPGYRNTLVKGLPQTLRRLGSILVDADASAQQIVQIVRSAFV